MAERKKMERRHRHERFFDGGEILRQANTNHAFPEEPPHSPLDDENEKNPTKNHQKKHREPLIILFLAPWSRKLTFFGSDCVAPHHLFDLLFEDRGHGHGEWKRNFLRSDF